MRILIVDDDPISAAFLQEWLRLRGCEIILGGRLSELEGLAPLAPDWLILDRHLPDGDGLAWVQQQAAAGELPCQVLLLSGDAPTAELPVKVTALQKPVDPDQLWARLGGASVLPELDDAVALRALNGQASVIHSIRAMFRQELAKSDWRLELADPARALSQLPAVHRLHGAAAMVGALQLSAIAQSVESLLRRGELPSAELLTALDQSINRLLPRLPLRPN